VYFECVWLLYRRFFDCFSVICNKTFYKVYTLFSHTHLTTLSQLLAVGGVTIITIIILCLSIFNDDAYDDKDDDVVVVVTVVVAYNNRRLKREYYT